MKPNEKVDYEKPGSELRDFLLNHRLVLESSTRSAYVRTMLESMRRSPDLAFYLVADAIVMLEDLLTRESERVNDILAKYSSNCIVINSEAEREAIQKIMEQNRAKREGGQEPK